MPNSTALLEFTVYCFGYITHDQASVLTEGRPNKFTISKHTTGTTLTSQDRLLLLPFRHYSLTYSTVSYLGFPSTFMCVAKSQPVNWLFSMQAPSGVSNL
jgi:hypothetical protein